MDFVVTVPDEQVTPVKLAASRMNLSIEAWLLRATELARLSAVGSYKQAQVDAFIAAEDTATKADIQAAVDAQLPK